MQYLEKRKLSNRPEFGLTVTRLAVAVSLTFAHAAAQNQQDQIKRVLLDQVSAWNQGNIDGFMRGYWDSDSTMFNSGGDLTVGYREVLARYKKNYTTQEQMGKLEFSDLVIRMLSPNAAVVMGTWKLIRSKDQPWGRFTLIVEKKPEGWRITHDHTSSAGK